MLTQERLKELLHYDPETGIFTRLDAKLVNKRLVGERAGSITKFGYREIQAGGKSYLEHRLAFVYMTGAFPKEETDHINHIKDDNRWCNLREANKSLNMQNRSGPNKGSATGLLGAYKDGNRFRSSIIVNGKEKHLGCFATPEEAHKIFVSAKRDHHPGWVE